MSLIPFRFSIGPMRELDLGKVRELEGLAEKQPQVPIRTEHIFHAGIYARTIYVPEGVMITGVLIKVPTLLIWQGDVTVYVGGDEPFRIRGHNVIPAYAGRKQAFVAISDMALTMLFPTKATTVEEAEEEFTDEADKLLSRRM